MRRPAPTLVPAEHEFPDPAAATTTASTAGGQRAGAASRAERDRTALRRQLEALETYYGIATPELIARHAHDALDGEIARAEAARWAELHATLARLTGEQAVAEQPPPPHAVPARARLTLA